MGGDAERWVLKNPESHAHGEMRRRHVPVKQIEVLGIAAVLAVAVVVVGAMALTGLILGAVAVGRGTSSGVDLPGNLALLADPSAVTGGLVTQNGAELTVVPFAVDNTTINFALDSVGAGAAAAINGTNRVRGLRANGTLDLAYTVVGNDVLLTGNLPATAAKLCGVSCTGNDVLAMAPNGTCLLCSTGVRATSFMRTCGTCPAFASVRLAANSSCYECLSISPNNILVGGGEVHAAARANDTFVYSTMPQMLADCTSATVGLTSYTYISGRTKSRPTRPIILETPTTLPRIRWTSARTRCSLRQPEMLPR